MIEIRPAGDTGWLVPTRNPEDFAEAVHYALDHPDEAGAVGERAAQYVRAELTVEKMVQRYRSLYDELLAQATWKGR